MAIRRLPVPQENGFQLAPQATMPILCHQQRGACRLREVAAGPVGCPCGVGSRVRAHGGAWAPLPPLYHARMLTDVGGTFGHHVFVVVDAGIRDSGLGLVGRDHKKFLSGEGKMGSIGR